jgi:hypothetical protein
MINGVNSNETTTNQQGGKQSRLDYRFDLIDAKAMFALAKVMHEGAQHYDVDNWRKISVGDHLNHAQSHIWAYQAGDKQDEHLEHAFTRLMMALAMSIQEPKPKENEDCRICHYHSMTLNNFIELGNDPCETCNDLSNWKPKEENYHE